MVADGDFLQFFTTFSCKTEWFVKLCNSTLSHADAALNQSVTTLNDTELCHIVSNKGSDSVTEYWKYVWP